MSYRVVSLGFDGNTAIRCGRLDEAAPNLDAAKKLARLRYRQVRCGWYGARYGVRILDSAGRAVCERTLAVENLGIPGLIAVANDRSPTLLDMMRKLFRRARELLSVDGTA